MRRTVGFAVACWFIIFGALGSAQAPPDKSSNVDAGQAAPAFQKQQAELDAVGVGRYQLVAGEFTVAKGAETQKAIFKIDTKTGATWIFAADPKNAASGTWKPIGR